MGTETADNPMPPASGLAWRLHELMGEGRRLSFLALDPARRHFGQDWPRVAAKVHAVVSSTLRDFLSMGDAHFPADELSYVIVSSGRTAGEIDKLMESISAEISSRITGKGMSKELVRVVHLGGDPDPASARVKIAAPAAIDAREHAGNIERIVAEAENCVEAFNIDTVRIGLSPVLSTAAMSTSAWVCQPVRTDGDGIVRRGYAVVPADIDPVIYAELDALTVEFAAHQLKDAPDRQMVVQIPVHRTTLSSKKYREMYLKICQGLLASRKDRVVFDIYGVDEGTPSNRVAEYLQWLRPYAKAVAITLDLDFSTVAAFSGVGALSIGVDIPGGEDASVVSRVGKFIGRVKAVNASCHVHGVSSKAQADICLQLGIDFMDGELIRDAPSP
jgi:hypothetical protein